MSDDGFWDEMYNAIYNSPIAVEAILTTAGGDDVTVRAVDKTIATPFLGMGGVEYQATRPFACIRMPEIDAAGLDVDADVQGGQLQMNGKIWSIKSFEYIPSPEGIAAGEVRLILQGGANVE